LIKLKMVRSHFVCSIAGAALLCGALLASAGTDNGVGNGGVNNGVGNSNCTPPGSYTVMVAGHWSGTGKATITGSSMALVTPVTDESGKPKTLTVANLTIQSNNHFTGTGDINGSPVTVTGRLEPKAPDANGNIKGWRIIATFHDASGMFGALVGAKDSSTNAGGVGVGAGGGATGKPS
jgi:hypothetical protein